jgi:hypothetical protein
MILTARFKQFIKAKIIGANLKVLAEIKVLALKAETLEGEKKENGTNFYINSVDNNDEELDDIKYRNNRGGYN